MLWACVLTTGGMPQEFTDVRDVNASEIMVVCPAQ